MLVASERNLSKGTRYEVTKREGRYGASGDALSPVPRGGVRCGGRGPPSTRPEA